MLAQSRDAEKLHSRREPPCSCEEELQHVHAGRRAEQQPRKTAMVGGVRGDAGLPMLA